MQKNEQTMNCLPLIQRNPIIRQTVAITKKKNKKNQPKKNEEVKSVQ